MKIIKVMLPEQGWKVFLVYLILASNLLSFNINIKIGVLAIRKWQAKRSLLRDGNSVGRGSTTSTNSNSPTKTAPPPEMTRIPLGTTKKSSLTSVASIASSISTNVGSWSDGQQQSSAGIPRKLDGIISSVEAMEIDEVGD